MAATTISYSGGLSRLKKQVLYGADRIVTITPGATGDASYDIDLRDRLIYIPSTAQTFTLTLPKVDEAMGLMFSIQCYLCASAVTLQDNDESFDFGGDYTLDATNDNITLYSNGMKWIEVHEDIA